MIESSYIRYCVFFFFQAEDGIRDYKVTGVQTCALPILGDWQELRYLSPEHGQTSAARLPDLVGDAPACGRRRNQGPRGTGRVSLSKRAGAKISHAPHIVWSHGHAGQSS